MSFSVKFNPILFRTFSFVSLGLSISVQASLAQDVCPDIANAEYSLPVKGNFEYYYSRRIWIIPIPSASRNQFNIQKTFNQLVKRVTTRDSSMQSQLRSVCVATGPSQLDFKPFDTATYLLYLNNADYQLAKSYWCVDPSRTIVTSDYNSYQPPGHSKITNTSNYQLLERDKKLHWFTYPSNSLEDAVVVSCKSKIKYRWVLTRLEKLLQPRGISDPVEVPNFINLTLLSTPIEVKMRKDPNSSFSGF